MIGCGAKAWPASDAITEPGRERARRCVLTAVTAILGVLPIAFGMNVEFLSREITLGAPATQWWINLSTAIVFGLGFATVLTLIVTPAALMALANLRERRLRWRAALSASRWPMPAFGRAEQSNRVRTALLLRNALEQV